MKKYERCELCGKRKAAHTCKNERWGYTLRVCEKCRREFYPTSAEIAEDELAETYRAERQAEIDAGVYNLP